MMDQISGQHYLRDIAESLQKAILQGNVEQTQELASILARSRASVEISLQKKDLKEADIRVKVYIEDQIQSNPFPIFLRVKPSTTVKELKIKMESSHKIPGNIMKWIIGKRIAMDNMTLAQCGIREDDCSLYLFLMPNAAGNPPPTAAVNTRRPEDPAYMSMHGFRVVVGDERPVTNLQGQGQLPAGIQNEAAQIMEEPIYDIIPEVIVPNKPADPKSGGAQKEPVQSEAMDGWICPVCTLLNAPTRPGCEACAADRPVDYNVPEQVKLTDAEMRRIEKERQQEALLKEAQLAKQRQAEQNFRQLVTLDEQSIITNTNAFDCLICFCDIEPGEGVVLRNCLHQFCKLCLADHIKLCEEAVVSCPYNDDFFSCQGTIQDREIAAIVDAEVNQKYLNRSLVQAESLAPNSFHCQTVNCAGWCIYDDENNFFKCPVCNQTNCLTCKAIHTGQNCKEYQDELTIKAANDVAAKQTKKYLEEMTKSGKAMYCPKCRIILQKKDGCDWIRCTMCKTEVCWVTKGPRWGPKGTGDLTGGCKCRANGGPACHPKCNNCH